MKYQTSALQSGHCLNCEPQSDLTRSWLSPIRIPARLTPGVSTPRSGRATGRAAAPWLAGTKTRATTSARRGLFIRGGREVPRSLPLPPRALNRENAQEGLGEPRRFPQRVPPASWLDARRLQHRANAGRRHGRLVDANTRRVEERVGDRRSHGSERGLARAARAP